MGWIRIVDAYGLQAVHRADGEEKARRYFCLADYPTFRAAESAAHDWLAACDVYWPNHRLRNRVQISKSYALPVGISYSVRNGRCRFQVNWHDGERARNKTFSVGRKRDYETAREAAVDFRMAYEACRRNGESFDGNI